MDLLPDYAELHALSNFSFQRGASHPEELVARAHALGYRAIAITDEGSVAGVVRAHGEAKKLGMRLVLGAEFKVQDAPVPLTLLVLVRNLLGWSQLCEFITRCRRSAGKGEYRCVWAEQDWQGLDHCEALCCLPQGIDADAASQAVTSLRGVFGERLWLALSLHLQVHDELKIEETLALSVACNVPVVATGAVLMHVRSRKPLHDAITAVAQGKPVSECGYALMANAEAHLRARQRLAQIYAPEWLAASMEIASRCTFSLDEIRYQYPMEVVGAGETPAQCLERLTYEGAQMRYPAGLPDAVQAQILHELSVIAQLHYEMYFLTVHDLVRFARSRGILCQGRGSAANSAVCYCLGVTEVDPSRMSVLFERFVSINGGKR
jgi:error-prone DNA polymerase